MAKFEIADKITGINEGGWANNPNDRGKETFAGIARNFWGSWLGWKYIDKYKLSYKPSSKISLAKWINSNAKLKTEPVMGLVVEFYRVNFWEINRLGDFKCQQLANTVYDFGVNSGKGRSAKFIQDIAGVDDDGQIGQVSINAINALDCKKAYDAFNLKRKNYYISIAIGNQREFLANWKSRLIAFDDHKQLA